MAKYLDSNGLSHFMTLIKNAISSATSGLISRTHRHTIGSVTGTAASLSTETKTFVTEASKVTLGTPASITPVTKKTVVTGGSKTSIPNISKKTVVTSHTAMSAIMSAGEEPEVTITRSGVTSTPYSAR